MTLEQIVEETRQWPPEKVGELVGRLTEELHTSDSENEASWKQVARQRIAEIENGKITPLDGEMVSEQVRKLFNR